MLLPVLVLTAATAQGTAPGPELHTALAAFERELDRAVRRVSLPTAVHALGISGACRGYYLAGYGAVFVLPPQALPGEGARAFVLRRSPRPSPIARVRAESQLDAATSPDTQLSFELLVDPGLAPPPDAARSSAQVQELERQLREIQLQVETFQRDAEQAREAADRNLQRVAEQLRVRLPDVPEDALAWVPAMPPPPSAPAAAPAAPEPPAEPAAPPAPEPPLPPWRFWFRSGGEGDPRPPERVIADVRAAITATLEGHGPALSVLRPQELVSVAVDFTSPVFALELDAPRPVRTLVLRVRKQDLDERRSGRLAAEELRRRIEALEY